MRTDFELAVIGGGLAGATAALALARKGFDVAAVSPPEMRVDHRTTALMMPSIALLQELGVWESVASKAAPLANMRIIDGTRRLLRAPTVSFHAGEIGELAFGYNIANADLSGALSEALSQEPRVTIVNGSAESATDGRDCVRVTLSDGTCLTARLAVAADGRRSVLRRAAGIRTRTWRYPQSALVTTFSHRFPHENISTEFHTETGPFTQVPLPGNRSSLVWVVPPREAAVLQELCRENLSARIEERMQSMLGLVTVDGPVQTFPLSGMIADEYGRGRIALVGEAAHVIPPIGAQGLNLGFRDVIALAEAVGHVTTDGDPGRAVAAYARSRRVDIATRTFGIDFMNRSLLSTFLPVHLLRSAGLAALARFSPLRSFAMREGMAPGTGFGVLGDSLRRRMDEFRSHGSARPDS